MTLAGSLLFARYAYPPNALGYCGPPDHGELIAAGRDRDTAGIAALARRFEGAWPYLELIAGCNHIADPLDLRVVAAYWIGNRLLDRVPAGALTASLDDRFARRAGRHRDQLAAASPLGGLPHHSFHVFAVYPWLGLLRAGRSVEPLTVLNRCMIRWGRVDRVDGDRVHVRARSLRFDGNHIALGPETTETLTSGPDSPAGRTRLVPGDAVSLHWDWVCDRLSPAGLARLVSYTGRNLAAVNALAVPGPLIACERGTLG